MDGWLSAKKVVFIALVLIVALLPIAHATGGEAWCEECKIHYMQGCHNPYYVCKKVLCGGGGETTTTVPSCSASLAASCVVYDVNSTVFYRGVGTWTASGYAGARGNMTITGTALGKISTVYANTSAVSPMVVTGSVPYGFTGRILTPTAGGTDTGFAPTTGGNSAGFFTSDFGFRFRVQNSAGAPIAGCAASRNVTCVAPCRASIYAICSQNPTTGLYTISGYSAWYPNTSKSNISITPGTGYKVNYILLNYTSENGTAFGFQLKGPGNYSIYATTTGFPAAAYPSCTNTYQVTCAPACSYDLSASCVPNVCPANVTYPGSPFTLTPAQAFLFEAPNTANPAGYAIKPTDDYGRDIKTVLSACANNLTSFNLSAKVGNVFATRAVYLSYGDWLAGIPAASGERYLSSLTFKSVYAALGSLNFWKSNSTGNYTWGKMRVQVRSSSGWQTLCDDDGFVGNGLECSASFDLRPYFPTLDSASNLLVRILLVRNDGTAFAVPAQEPALSGSAGVTSSVSTLIVPDTTTTSPATQTITVTESAVAPNQASISGNVIDGNVGRYTSRKPGQSCRYGYECTATACYWPETGYCDHGSCACTDFRAQKEWYWKNVTFGNGTVAEIACDKGAPCDTQSDAPAIVDYSTYSSTAPAARITKRNVIVAASQILGNFSESMRRFKRQRPNITRPQPIADSQLLPKGSACAASRQCSGDTCYWPETAWCTTLSETPAGRVCTCKSVTDQRKIAKEQLTKPARSGLSGMFVASTGEGAIVIPSDHCDDTVPGCIPPACPDGWVDCDKQGKDGCVQKTYCNTHCSTCGNAYKAGRLCKPDNKPKTPIGELSCANLQVGMIYCPTPDSPATISGKASWFPATATGTIVVTNGSAAFNASSPVSPLEFSMPAAAGTYDIRGTLSGYKVCGKSAQVTCAAAPPTSTTTTSVPVTTTTTIAPTTTTTVQPTTTIPATTTTVQNQTCAKCQTQVDVFWGPVIYAFNNGSRSVRYGDHNRLIATWTDSSSPACSPLNSTTAQEGAMPSFNSSDCDLGKHSWVSATIDSSKQSPPNGYISATMRVNSSMPAYCGPYSIGLATYKADSVRYPSAPNNIDKQEYYDSKSVTVKAGDPPVTIYVKAPMNADQASCHAIPGTTTTIPPATTTVPATTTTQPPATTSTVAPCGGTICTYTQGGWGAVPAGNNPGAILAANWKNMTGGNLTLGAGKYRILFTSAAAIKNYLPAGGRGAVLNRSYNNPTTTYSGVLGGQLTALKLNLLYSPRLGDFYITSGAFAGMHVRDFLSLSERYFGRDPTAYLPPGATLANIIDTADSINRAYDGCAAPSAGKAAYCVAPGSGGSGNFLGFLKVFFRK